jgi:hypothetical protein
LHPLLLDNPFLIIGEFPHPNSEAIFARQVQRFGSALRCCDALLGDALLTSLSRKAKARLRRAQANLGGAVEDGGVGLTVSSTL